METWVEKFKENVDTMLSNATEDNTKAALVLLRVNENHPSGGEHGGVVMQGCTDLSSHQELILYAVWKLGLILTDQVGDGEIDVDDPTPLLVGMTAMIDLVKTRVYEPDDDTEDDDTVDEDDVAEWVGTTSPTRH